jgi:hypothetical protein
VGQVCEAVARVRLLNKAPDGGKNSGVTGFFLVEMKSLFSIVLLRFNKGSREAFHEHAFNAVTIWLKGRVIEHELHNTVRSFPREFKGGQIKFTRRNCFHKIEALEPTWALSFRGPWVDRWREKRGDKLVTLTHGRKVVG